MAHEQCPRCFDTLSGLTEMEYQCSSGSLLKQAICVVCQAEVGALPRPVAYARLAQGGAEREAAVRVAYADRVVFDAIVCAILPAAYAGALQSHAVSAKSKLKKCQYLANLVCELALVVLEKRNALVRPVQEGTS